MDRTSHHVVVCLISVLMVASVRHILLDYSVALRSLPYLARWNVPHRRGDLLSLLNSISEKGDTFRHVSISTIRVPIYLTYFL
jgi:hypothetical protein